MSESKHTYNRCLCTTYRQEHCVCGMDKSHPVHQRPEEALDPRDVFGVPLASPTPSTPERHEFKPTFSPARCARCGHDPDATCHATPAPSAPERHHFVRWRLEPNDNGIDVWRCGAPIPSTSGVLMRCRELQAAPVHIRKEE